MRKYVGALPEQTEGLVVDIEAFLNMLTCPKELWLYEGVFHPMGEVAADMYPAVADWMLGTLTDGLPAGHDRRIVIPE